MAQASTNPGASQGGNEGFTDEDIIWQAANMWDMEIKPQDLQNVKPEFVKAFYLSFLRDMNVSIDKYNQIPPQLVDMFQYADEHKESLRVAMLAADMKKFVKRIFDDESFRLADVWNPKPKRSKRFFAMTLDFLQFVDGCVMQIDETEDKVLVAIDQGSKTKARLHKLQQQISERKAAIARNQVATEEEMRRVEAMTEELRKCQEERLVVKGEHDALSLTLANLSVAVKDAELAIVEAESEMHRLEGLVIRPEEQLAIKRRDEQLAVKKEENEKKEEHVAELERRVEEMASVQDMLDNMMSSLLEVEQEVAKEKEFQAACQQTVALLTGVHDVVKERTQRDLDLTHQLTIVETKLQRLHQEWHLQRESLEKEIVEKKEILESVQQSQTEDDIVCRDMALSIAQLDKQLRKSKEREKSINNTIRKEYENIKNMVLEGSTEIKNALTEIQCLLDFDLKQ